MGTWALHSFANDDASDPIGDLVEVVDLSLVLESIKRVKMIASWQPGRP